ncbi:MAG: serine acetyltransferase [Treponema sp.]|jgi:serine O-acetyltransferase|nr:serine acetyltransferase [Treponema sp.]
MQHEANTRVKHLVDILSRSYRDHAEIIKIDAGSQLNRSVIIDILERLRKLIFPGYFGKKHLSADLIEYYAGDLLEEVIYDLTPELAKALRHLDDTDFSPGEKSSCELPFQEQASDIAFTFLSKLPEIREYLAADVSAAFDGDPAAFSKDEIISSYPGIYAIMVYRLAHALCELRVPLIPRIMTEHAHSVTGIDIHPGAVIGHHFFIDHGTGIVIGETTIIGNHVKIYQGVTLGGLSTRGGQALKGTKRHPTIEDHVTIYSGASIFGGATIIGEGVVIGSNAFITKSVPEKTRVSVKNPEMQYKVDGQGAHAELAQDGFWDWVI